MNVTRFTVKMAAPCPTFTWCSVAPAAGDVQLLRNKTSHKTKHPKIEDAVNTFQSQNAAARFSSPLSPPLIRRRWDWSRETCSPAASGFDGQLFRPKRRRFAALLQAQSWPRQQAALHAERAFRLLPVARCEVRSGPCGTLRPPELRPTWDLSHGHCGSARPAPYPQFKEQLAVRSDSGPLLSLQP